MSYCAMIHKPSISTQLVENQSLLVRHAYYTFRMQSILPSLVRTCTSVIFVTGWKFPKRSCIQVLADDMSLWKLETIKPHSNLDHVLCRRDISYEVKRWLYHTFVNAVLLYVLKLDSSEFKLCGSMLY